MKKKMIVMVMAFLLLTLAFYPKKTLNESFQSEMQLIEVSVSGEIVRDVKLYFSSATTYGVVFKKIETLKNEFSNLSIYDMTTKIEASLEIHIPTYDILNQYEQIGEKVCINTAGIEKLTTLYQIGVKRAAKIIEYREKNGKILTFEKLREIISVSYESLEKIKQQAVL